MNAAAIATIYNDMSRPRPHIPPADVTGLILAGGQARRMGGVDKGLVPFAGRPLVQWVVEALRPQVAGLLLSANRNQATYAALGWPVLTDELTGFQGPLAGIAAGLAACPTPWLVTLPCDGPWPPPDLVARLAVALTAADADLAIATDGTRQQQLYALLPRTLAADLTGFLAAGERTVAAWQARHRVAVADFSDRPDGFTNINSPADASRLATLATAR